LVEIPLIVDFFVEGRGRGWVIFRGRGRGMKEEGGLGDAQRSGRGMKEEGGAG